MLKVGDDTVETLARRRGRFIAAGMVAIAAILTAFVSDEIQQGGSFPVIFLPIGAFCALFGLAGLVEPRVLWSIGPKRGELPASVRAIGAALGIATIGAALGLWSHLEGWW